MNQFQYDNLIKSRNEEFEMSNLNTIITNSDIPNIDDDDESESEYGEDKEMTKVANTIEYADQDELAESFIKDYHIIEAETEKSKRLDKKKENSDHLQDESADEVDENVFVSLNDQQEAEGKSQFYFSTSEEQQQQQQQQPQSPTDQQDYFFTKLYENERVIDSLSNITCLYSTNVLNSKQFRDITTDIVRLKGKLLLTSFQIIFIPYVNQVETKIADLDQDILCLFANKLYPYSFVIPLTFIFEIRSSNPSDKYRRLENIIDNRLIVRDLLIKCKNFMTKLLIFPNPNKNYERINKFIKNLITSSNNQVKNERFKHLILSVVSNTAAETSKNSNRKSYLSPNDLHQDLIDCECDNYMQVKSGAVNISIRTSTGNIFEIKTNMPFFAAPKNVASILSQRVVTNELNVNEFNPEQATNQQMARKTSRVAELLGGPSSRSKPSSNKINVNETPVIAELPNNNPFYEKNFPTWSFTDTSTGCSLIIVPDCSHSNKQEECDIIIKNYNALLCDEVAKLKKTQANNLIRIQSNQYAEYEYYKFKVPFDYRKISESYLKLLETCSFKTTADYHKENESSSFYIHLNNSKWFKKLSSLIQLTTKIVNCLHFDQRNVFIEEYRGNTDCSCILTSLVKLCMNRRYRTIVGFENLIQKDWFLAGHMFNKRLEANLVTSNSEEFLLPSESDRLRSSFSANPIAESNAQLSNANTKSSHLAPTFLLFLDCVFQLLNQFPEDFEFNEIYLIHMWDYVCSSASLTFSFDGVTAWQTYLENQTFIIPTNMPIDPDSKAVFTRKIFDANNTFWLNHLETNLNKFLVNKKYEPKTLILTPSDKLYAIRFWSRCYLRWHEKYHSYNTHDYVPKSQEVDKKVGTTPIRTHRPAPPPPSHSLTALSLNKDLSGPSSRVTISPSGLKITTRITEDGNIESSF